MISMSETARSQLEFCLQTVPDSRPSIYRIVVSHNAISYSTEVNQVSPTEMSPLESSKCDLYVNRTLISCVVYTQADIHKVWSKNS